MYEKSVNLKVYNKYMEIYILMGTESFFQRKTPNWSFQNIIIVLIVLLVLNCITLFGSLAKCFRTDI